jgi:hypothetical protein
MGLASDVARAPLPEIHYICRRCAAPVEMHLDHVGAVRLSSGECTECPGTFVHPRRQGCLWSGRTLKHAHVVFKEGTMT